MHYKQRRGLSGDRDQVEWRGIGRPSRGGIVGEVRRGVRGGSVRGLVRDGSGVGCEREDGKAKGRGRGATA